MKEKIEAKLNQFGQIQIKNISGGYKVSLSGETIKMFDTRNATLREEYQIFSKWLQSNGHDITSSTTDMIYIEKIGD